MKRKMPFIAALSILCWGCSSYDYSGDDIVGVKAAISGTITEVVEKSLELLVLRGLMVIV